MKYTIIIWILCLCSIGYSYDVTDFSNFSSDWLSSNARSDFNSDGIVNFLDYVILISDFSGFPAPRCTTDPAAATLPDPNNHATGVSLSKVLTWSVADCNGEETRNDVYFGDKTGTLAKVVSDSAIHSYTPTLTIDHGYKWRIDTINAHGITTGVLWDFNCTSSPPSPPHVPPTAAATSATVMAQNLSWVYLGGSAHDPNATLHYIVTSLPTDGFLYDELHTGERFSTKFRKFGYSSSNIRQITTVPYTIAHNYSSLMYLCTTASPTTATFGYKCNDGVADSNMATVTITRTAYDQNNIELDGGGVITIPHTAAVDFNTTWGFTCWVKTQERFSGIMKKRGTSGGGVEIGIESGRLTVQLWDANNRTATYRSSRNISNKKWNAIGVTIKPNTVLMVVDANYADWFYNTGVFRCHNTEPVIIGKTDARYFTGGIDRIKFWQYFLTDSLPGLGWFEFNEPRNGKDQDFFALTGYSAFFACDEKAGNSIRDANGVMTGTFDANHVKFNQTESPLKNYSPKWQTFGGD